MDNITSARDISGLEPIGVLPGLTPLCVPMEPANGFAEETQLRARPRIVSLWERLGLIYLLEQPQSIPVNNTRVIVNNFTAQMVFRLCSMNHTDRLIERYQPGFVFPDKLRRVSQENMRLVRSAEVGRFLRSFTENSRYTEEVSRVFRLVFEKETGGIPLQTVCRALAALLGSSGGGAVFTAQQRRIFERIATVLGTEYPESPVASVIGSLGAASGFTDEQRRHITEAVGKTGARPEMDAARAVLRLAELGKTPSEAESAIRSEVRSYGFIRPERNLSSSTATAAPSGSALKYGLPDGSAVAGAIPSPPRGTVRAESISGKFPEILLENLTNVKTNTSSQVERVKGAPTAELSVNAVSRRIAELVSGSAAGAFSELLKRVERIDTEAVRADPEGSVTRSVTSETPWRSSAARIFLSSPAGAFAERLFGGSGDSIYAEMQHYSTAVRSEDSHAGNVQYSAPGNAGDVRELSRVTEHVLREYAAKLATENVIRRAAPGNPSRGSAADSGAVAGENQAMVTAPALSKLLGRLYAEKSGNASAALVQPGESVGGTLSAVRETAELLRRYSRHYSVGQRELLVSEWEHMKTTEFSDESVISRRGAVFPAETAREYAQQIPQVDSPELSNPGNPANEREQYPSQSAPEKSGIPLRGAVLPAETTREYAQQIPQVDSPELINPGNPANEREQYPSQSVPEKSGTPLRGAVLPAETTREYAQSAELFRNQENLSRNDVPEHADRSMQNERTERPESSKQAGRPSGNYRDRLDGSTLAALEQLIAESGPPAGAAAVGMPAPEPPAELAYTSAEQNVAPGDVLRTVSIVRESMLRRTENHMTRLIERAAKAAQSKSPASRPYKFRTADSAENMVMLVPPTEMDRSRAQQSYMGSLPPIELKEPQPAQASPASTRTVTTDRTAAVRTIVDSRIDGLTRDEISRLADKVYERIETKLTRERRRMGL